MPQHGPRQPPARRTVPQQVVVVDQVLVRPRLLLHAQLHRALQHADHVLQVLLKPVADGQRNVAKRRQDLRGSHGWARALAQRSLLTLVGGGCLPIACLLHTAIHATHGPSARYHPPAA